MEQMLKSISRKIINLTISQNVLSIKMDTMASNTDLVAMRQDITEDTKKSITEALGPIKTEVSELRERLNLTIADLEKQKALYYAGGGAGSSYSSNIPPDIKIILDCLDPAHKVLFLLGFHWEWPMRKE